MGWRTEEGYYDPHTKGEKEGVSYKIVSWQQAMNKLGPSQVREGISLVAKKLARENGNPIQESTRPVDEPIEYVVEGIDEELDR